MFIVGRWFFCERYGDHRHLTLLTHSFPTLRSPDRMDEAENELMRRITFIEISKPTLFELAVIIGVQWVFYVCFFALYLISSKTAHRVVGYFEDRKRTRLNSSH